MKARVVVTRDEAEKPIDVQIRKGRSKLHIKHLYTPSGEVYLLDMQGRGDFPSVADIWNIINTRRLDRIGVIETIESIEDIESATISVAANEEVEFIDADDDRTVNAGASATVAITPPAGYLYEVLGLYLGVVGPEGATSGTHYFDVYDVSTNIGITKGVSNFNKTLYYDYGVWLVADSAQYPPTDSEQQLQVKGKRFDEDNPMRIRYGNATDAAQAGTRFIRVHVRKIRVA